MRNKNSGDALAVAKTRYSVTRIASTTAVILAATMLVAAYFAPSLVRRAGQSYIVFFAIIFSFGVIYLDYARHPKKTNSDER